MRGYRADTTRAALLAAPVLLVAAVIFSVHHSFLSAYLWDDDFALIADGRTFDPEWSFGFTQRTHFYRPLIELYFDLMVALFGYSPSALHAGNVALHILNASLVFFLARRLLRGTVASLAAALFFAVLPAILDAVAWVSAVTALLMATWYLATMILHVAWLDSGDRRYRAASVLSFVAALLCHEGAVTLLPVLIGMEFVASDRRRPLLNLVRSYGGFALVLGVYLTIAFIVNRQNYVVTEGQYRLGLHAIRNVLQYVSALYVGRRGLTGLGITALGLMAAWWYGDRAVRFSLAWMIVALMPYVFFVHVGAGRYAYVAAAAFGMLLAGVLQSLDRALQSRIGPTRASVAVIMLTVAIGGRFAVLAVRSTTVTVEAGEEYRSWAAAFRRAHPVLPRGGSIAVADPHWQRVDPRAFLPLLQLEYADPGLQVRIDPDGLTVN